MRLIRIEAIVLRSERSGEKDRVVYLLTRELGLIRAGAKGKKWGSRLEPGAVIKGLVYTGKGYTLTEGELLLSHQALRKDLILWNYTSLVLESAFKAVLPGEKDAPLYELVNTTLGLLENSSVPLKITLAYFLKLFSLSGYTPDLKNCVVCGAVRGDGYLSHKNGGYVCLSCGVGKGLPMLSIAELSLLEGLRTTPMEELSISGEVPGIRLSRALFGYFEGVFEFKLHSAEVLEQLFTAFK